MNNFQNIYNTHEYHVAKGLLQYYFVSKGGKDIVKVVQYQYVKDFDGRPLFNLGFGDYDMVTGTVSDEEVSNNKDQYKAFHTVLNTVPRLFDTYGDVILMAQGSDSKQGYIDKCRVSCSKKCGVGICKNAHRRISIYRGFIDKYYEELIENYIFHCGEDIGNQNLIESYQKGKKYNAVLVTRKNS
jgi:uncharacterized protein DUF6934